MDQGIFAPIFFAMIGSWGRAVIGWALENPTPVGAFFTVWLVLFAASQWQLNRIKERTNILAIEQAQKQLGDNPSITVKQFYEALRPAWEQMVRASALFIPHRWELWPLPATPGIVEQRIDFSEEWLGEFLWLEEIKMRGAKPREDAPEEDPLTKMKKMSKRR